MMKSFSASAPRLTAAQLRTEIASQSEEEKEKAARDLYGRECPIVETDDMLASATLQLRRAMEQLPPQSKHNYMEALVRCPDHADDPTFLLMFLRCEEFDVDKAAVRMGTYWEKKVELFGQDRAFHRLTLADFDVEDSVALQQGGTRFFPMKDKAGRGLIFVEKNRYEHRMSHRKSMMRQVWYIHHVALEDVEVQRRGIVYIAECPSTRCNLFEQDRKLDSILLKHVRYALPVRIVGVHHYLSSVILELFVPLILPLFGATIRARYRYHMGCSSDEWVAKLATYGIPADCLPTELGGTLEFSYEQWLESRQQNCL